MRIVKWLLGLFFMFFVAGCNGSLKTGTITLVVNSVPEGIFHYRGVVASTDQELSFDPWKALSLLMTLPIR